MRESDAHYSDNYWRVTIKITGRGDTKEDVEDDIKHHLSDWYDEKIEFIEFEGEEVLE